jgi:hypothetical protein
VPANGRNVGKGSGSEKGQTGRHNAKDRLPPTGMIIRNEQQLIKINVRLTYGPIARGVVGLPLHVSQTIFGLIGAATLTPGYRWKEKKTSRGVECSDAEKVTRKHPSIPVG